jgi:hypothetical protein
MIVKAEAGEWPKSSSDRASRPGRGSSVGRIIGLLFALVANVAAVVLVFALARAIYLPVLGCRGIDGRAGAILGWPERSRGHASSLDRGRHNDRRHVRADSPHGATRRAAAALSLITVVARSRTSRSDGIIGGCYAPIRTREHGVWLPRDAGDYSGTYMVIAGPAAWNQPCLGRVCSV